MRRSARLALPLLVAAVVAEPDRRAAADNLWPTNGWAISTPEAQGMDSTLLAEARDFAVTGGGAGIVTRAGYSVMSWGSQSSRKGVKSATKSIGVTILGLALDDGLVAIDDAAVNHLADFGVPPVENDSTGWLPSITLEQLATHAAGFDKAGGYIELEYEPGTVWKYSDGGANWLADVLTVTHGEDLHDVLFARVLDPMGVTTNDLRWRDHDYRDDLIQGIKRREFGSGITVDVDAMAKIGYLYLRGGEWDGQRILSESFVEMATGTASSIGGLTIEDPVKYPNATSHYGLLWWNNSDGALPNVPPDTYWAWGLNENLIVVIPSLDVVVARGASDGWQPGWSTDYNVLAPFLDPIVESVQVEATSVRELEPATWGSIKARFHVPDSP